MKKVIKNNGKFGLEKFTVAKLENMIQIKGGDAGGNDTRPVKPNGPPPPPVINIVPRQP